MNGPLDHFSNQQRERDSNSNINRDMVLLVVLVVMIQVNIQKKISIIWIILRRPQNLAKSSTYFWLYSKVPNKRGVRITV